MRAVLLLLLLSLCACSSQRAAGDTARAEGRFADAAEAYGVAAVETSCPERSDLLLLRAEMQDAEGTHASAADTIEKAIGACPNHPEPTWVRAQRRLADGDRDGALADATRIADVHPGAATLKAEIERLLARHASARNAAADKLETLEAALDVEAPDKKLARKDPASFTRLPPVPMTARYAVRQTAHSPDAFELTWTEETSYRGEAGAETFFLVRKLEVPELDNTLPWPVRLTMSNQRQPMRFEIDQKGKVVDARWHIDGPQRGMRPDMLKPEVEGSLQRRRLYDPGERGVRTVGEAWSGLDVKVLDGKAVELRYDSTFVRWESVRGVDCVRVESKLTGPGTTGAETVWLHPESSVPVQWRRTLEYPTTDPDGTKRRWSEASQGVLVSVSSGG